MKLFTLPFLLLLSVVLSQAATVRHDNDTPKGSYSDSRFITYEETVFIKPAGPCKINKIHIYLSGTVPKTDTIRVVGDPSDGGLPPSQYVWDYNCLLDPIVINYSGTPGWLEIDVSNTTLRSDGLDRIGIQHIIQSGGPYFTFDSDGQNSLNNSYLNDASRPNPDFYNIRGTIFSYASGNFMVKLDVSYDFPLGETSAQSPAPRLVDVSLASGLFNGTVQTPIASELVTVADWNSDGYDDIAIRSKFFENKGNGEFEDVSTRIGINAASTVWADADNDGYMDCFALVGMGSDQMYWGKPDGSMEINTDADIKPNAPAVTPMWLDYNNDGLLDLFIAYGRTESSQGEVYFPDKLYKNLGNRQFEDVSETSKIKNAEPAGNYDCWGASITDIDMDNKPDIFVATYRLAPDLLHYNLGDGTFTETGQETGVRGIPTHSPEYFGHGMGSDWADYNNDGFLDLAVGNLGHPDERGLWSNPSLIFKNNGSPDYLFTNVTNDMGLKFFEMNAGLVWADLDLDGWQDIFHCQYSYYAKGKENDKMSRVYINQGPENNFRLVDKTWEFGSLIHGAWSPARLDFDGDGDMDILVGSSNERVKLFRNDIIKNGNWISFRLSGNPAENVSNNAYGSWVKVYSGNNVFTRALPGSVISARASQSSDELNFGLGNISAVDSVVIKYPNGKKNKITNIRINNRYNVPYMAAPIPVKLSVPDIVNPPDCGLLSEAQKKLSWAVSDGAVSYKIVVKKLPEGTIIADNLVSNTNNIDAPGEAGNTYSWSVQAVAANEATSDFSSDSRYTIGFEKPFAPVLTTHADNPQNVSVIQTFKWDQSEYICGLVTQTTYDLQISSNSDFSEIETEITNINDLKYKLEPAVLRPNTSYYFRVRGVNFGFTGDWSGTRAFSTMPLPQVPEPNKPAKGETDVKVKPTLEWTESVWATGYHLEVSDDESFSNIVYAKTDLTSNRTTIFKALKGETKYYWRVKAYNDGGSEDWSEVYDFVTGKGTSIDDHSESVFPRFDCTPNPSNKKTIFNFELKKNSDVRLAIYDVSGSLVKEIFHGNMDAGLHQKEWDAGNSPAGTYYCRLSAGNHEQTIKLVVLK